MSDELKFEIHQKVVYPSQGVGKITDIVQRKFKDEMLTYYVIFLEVSDMTVMVPVKRVDELGIRAIVSAEEAQHAIDMMGEAVEPVTSDWKLRYQMNLDLLKKGTVSDIATIVRCLYHRSKVKELPILERKLYDSAKKLLEDEISFALDKPVQEVEALLLAKLEPLGLIRDTKHAALSDDFDDEDEEFIGDDEDEDIVDVEEDEDGDSDDGDEE
ncbi:MAG: CarD family transcriptional regulator [Candidatus Treponema excrementipullorum]|uniref:CarD family transcriptional regulator n=1 Tax=Candidatus Treponema excrementipullorum TaxID=2838768 RepID=A0A9E2L305_9SPIR|nr:CarD family transcriptional regulator [Candidatus Treponema excrementipullorum]MDY2756863.1 CarD family transcriptional regulator [Candidatus Treponema excrementipullorum]